MLPWQIVSSVPAFAVGFFLIKSVLLSEAEAEQGEIADTVNVNVIVPTVISAALGV